MGDASAFLGGQPTEADIQALPAKERIEWVRRRLAAQAEQTAVDLKNKVKPDAIMEQILLRQKKREEFELPDAATPSGKRGIPATVGTLPSPVPDLLGRR